MLQARFGMPPTQPTGMPAPCPCGFCTVALQQLRDGTWGTGRGDWADLWAVLSPIVRGVNLIPCDPDTCCGRCCTIAPDDLADLAAWDKRDDADE